MGSGFGQYHHQVLIIAPSDIQDIFKYCPLPIVDHIRQKGDYFLSYSRIEQWDSKYKDEPKQLINWLDQFKAGKTRSQPKKYSKELIAKPPPYSHSYIPKNNYKDKPPLKRAQASHDKMSKQKQRDLIEEQDHQAVLAKLSKQLEEETEKNKRLKDPERIQEANEKRFEIFVNSLKTYDQLYPPGSKKIEKASMIGQNSAGKSSVCNWQFGTELEVGIDDTTQELSIVYKNPITGICYWDSPGINDTTNETSKEFLGLLYQLDWVFIASSVTFKKLKRVILMVNKINPPRFYLVRTQCDKFKGEELSDAKKRDLEVLESWGVKCPILYISVRKGYDFEDNERFRSLFTDTKL